MDPAGARRIVAGQCPPGLRAAPDFPDEDDQIAAGMFLQRLAVAPDPGPFGIFVITVVEGAGPPIAVGGIGFHGPPDESGDVEIGYAVVPSHRRRGVAGVAVAAVIAYARAHEVARLIAEVDPDNAASLRVVAAAGFRPVSTEATLEEATAGPDAARRRFALSLR